MSDSITVARLACDEPTARGIAAALGESLDADDCVCAAFEDTDGRWQVSVHFRRAPDEAAVRALVQLTAGEIAARALSFTALAEADWVEQCLAGLPPVSVGRFLLHGAHDRARVPANVIGIEIEAALAFGTGHHGTTRGCLRALDALAKRGRRHLRRVLDIGTGSGVLAIAAAKILRGPVIASDIDARAVETARGNARLNGVARSLTLVRAAGTKTRAVTKHAPFDLVFANILLAPLLRLAVPIRRLSRPGGYLVLSGLLPGQANSVLAIYRAQGLMLVRRIALDGWVTLMLQRPANPTRRNLLEVKPIKPTKRHDRNHSFPLYPHKLLN